MNLFLFITVLIVSFIVVRIGAIAFQLTGLEWSLAKFQSLSCFTGTGFTTKESELITGNPQRRRMASVLIVFGHAGFVTMIATFANTLRPGAVIPKFSFPFLRMVVPLPLLPWINLIIIIIAIYAIYKIFTNTKLTDAIRLHIMKREIIKPVTFSELAIATGGYGVSQIEICKDSPVLNKTILGANLKKLDILVLAVVRDEATIPNPSADTMLLLGDSVICFGKLGNIRRKVCIIPA